MIKTILKDVKVLSRTGLINMIKAGKGKPGIFCKNPLPFEMLALRLAFKLWLLMVMTMPIIGLERILNAVYFY
jgi:hypothetical protein